MTECGGSEARGRAKGATRRQPSEGAGANGCSAYRTFGRIASDNERTASFMARSRERYTRTRLVLAARPRRTGNRFGISASLLPKGLSSCATPTPTPLLPQLGRLQVSNGFALDEVNLSTESRRVDDFSPEIKCTREVLARRGVPKRTQRPLLFFVSQVFIITRMDSIYSRTSREPMTDLSLRSG